MEAHTAPLLLVHSAEDERARIAGLLRGAELNVVPVADGGEAAARIEETRFSLILADATAATIDGCALCRQAKTRPVLRETPFILLLPTLARSRLVEGINAGADHVLISPFPDAYLLDRVRTALTDDDAQRRRSWDGELDLDTPKDRFFVNLLCAAYQQGVHSDRQLSDTHDKMRTLNRELQQSTQRLRDTEDVFHMILETSSDGVVVVDRRSAIQYINPAAERLFHKTRRELIGSTLPFIVTPDSVTEVALGPDATVHAETRATETVWKGEPVYLVALRDITRRKRAEHAFYESEKQLRQAQKIEAIGRLAGGVAHDFNNILAVIMGQSQLLEMTMEEEDPLRAKVAEILRATKRGAALTRHLLVFSRRQVSRPRVLNTNELLRKLTDMLSRLIGEHIDLRLATKAEQPTVKADPNQIEQVVMNLVVNARDVMRDGGKITIETSNVEFDREYVSRHDFVSPGEYVMIAVSDNGPGIPDDVQPFIFEPFFTTKEEGTGLGLCTVHSIVQQNGGYIWVYSEPDKGATFKVYLPLVTGQLGKDTTIISLRAEEGRGSGTVLVVEDDDNLRRMVEEIMRHKGYSVLSAANGHEALHVLKLHKSEVDLMLTDVVMPKMNGPKLARQAAELQPGLRVLFMSGYPDEVVIDHGVKTPGTNLLQKPFTPHALLEKVSELLGDAP